MREVKDHQTGNGLLDDLIRVEAAVEPGAGGACHHYQFYYRSRSQWHKGPRLDFQDGPLADPDKGPNGLTLEAVLAVAIDRLRGFQDGPCACRENAVALTHLETALMWLQRRTRDRLARGVLGQSVK